MRPLAALLALTCAARTAHAEAPARRALTVYTQSETPSQNAPRRRGAANLRTADASECAHPTTLEHSVARAASSDTTDVQVAAAEGMRSEMVQPAADPYAVSDAHEASHAATPASNDSLPAIRPYPRGRRAAREVLEFLAIMFAPISLSATLVGAARIQADHGTTFAVGATALSSFVSMGVIGLILDPGLESDWASRQRHHARLRIAPTIALSPDGGGGVVGVQGRF